MKEIRCKICNSSKIIKKDDGYICDECGTKYTIDEMKDLLVEVSETPVSVQAGQPSGMTKSSTSSTLANKKIMIPLVLIIIAVIGFVFWNSTLFGNDKAAYDLIMRQRNTFKDPYSVRVLSAYYFDNGDDPVVWANISANNSYGVRVTACYAFTNSYALESDYCGKNGSNVNVDKINKQLEKAK